MLPFAVGLSGLAASLGLAVVNVATLITLGQTSGSPAAPSAIPYIASGGGATAAVTGLIYFARLVFKGEMVPKDINDILGRLDTLEAQSVAREERVTDALEQSAHTIAENTKVMRAVERRKVTGR